MKLRRAAAAAALSAAVIAPLCSAPALATGAAPSSAAAAPTQGERIPFSELDASNAKARPGKSAAGAQADRTAAAGPDGTYHALSSSVRLLDTRNGNGSPVMLWPKGAIALQVGGRGNVPSSGVSAVVMNLTAVGPTAGTWITAWPSGGTEPRTSNLNVNAGETRANLVTVAVGADGKVNLRNANGHTHLLADVVGYYSNASGATGGGYHPEETPFRSYDSREAAWPWEAGEISNVPVPTPSMDPDTVDAVAVNVTAMSNCNGFLSVWGNYGGRPTTSTVNFLAGRPTPNLAVVPVIYDEIDDYPRINVYNSCGLTHVFFDVVGWYDWDASGSTFTAVQPDRVLDTRLNNHGPVAGASTAFVPTAAVAPGAVSVVANVTGVSPTRDTWLGVAATSTKPNSSTLNLVPGENRPNLTHAPVSGTGFYVYNGAGSTHVIADVFGYFH